MADKTHIPKPKDLGHEICGRLIFGNHDTLSLSLHALLHVVGLSQSDVARMAGVTRARIGHFSAGHGEVGAGQFVSVPKHRAVQFHKILRGVVEAFEENLEALKEDPNFVKDAQIKEMFPVAEVIVKTCRQVLETESRTMDEAKTKRKARKP